MTKVFNPPPNWPQPPKSWVPPVDWRPDPTWGPAPVGWQLWIDEAGAPGSVQPSAPKEKRIFLSYRRSDCQPQANAISDGLRHRLAPAKIFMDIDSIPAGVDFAQHIREEIEICDVVLVLIGDDWLSAVDREGRRRIEDPADFVRLEIENAFASPRVSVVPILVEQAEMPRSSDLPESLQRLATINAIELSDQRWTSDIERLAKEIKRLEAYQEARARRVEHAEPEVQATPHLDAPPMQPHVAAYPQQAAAPAYSGTPPGQDNPTLGWIMVAIPIVSCGLLSFVPSAYVAYVRREDKQLLTRSLIICGAFFLAVIAAIALVGTAPQDASGTSVGAASDVGAAIAITCAVAAAILAAFQRAPSEALTAPAQR